MSEYTDYEYNVVEVNESGLVYSFPVARSVDLNWAAILNDWGHQLLIFSHTEADLSDPYLQWQPGSESSEDRKVHAHWPSRDMSNNPNGYAAELSYERLLEVLRPGDWVEVGMERCESCGRGNGHSEYLEDSDCDSCLNNPHINRWFSVRETCGPEEAADTPVVEIHGDLSDLYLKEVTLNCLSAEAQPHEFEGDLLAHLDRSDATCWEYSPCPDHDALLNLGE